MKISIRNLFICSASVLGIFILSLLISNTGYAQFNENFDSVTPPALPALWTTAQTNAGVNWTTTTSDFQSSPNSVYTSGPGMIGTATFTSPAFIFDGFHVLSFGQKYSLESGYDGAVLEVKIGSGSFVDIAQAPDFFSTCPYTATLSSSFSNPLSGRSAWTGSSSSFKGCVVFLAPSAVGQLVQFRWIIGTDSAVASSGWWLDDVQMMAITDLELTETTDTSAAVAGQTLTYHTTLTNRGNMSVSGTMSKLLPRGSTLVSTSSNNPETNVDSSRFPVVEYNSPDLDAGGSVEVTTTVSLPNPAVDESLLTVNSPPISAGDYAARQPLFGPRLTEAGITGDLVAMKDAALPAEDGCDALTNGPELVGKIALGAATGVCDPQITALAAQNAGAIGLIIVLDSGSAIKESSAPCYPERRKKYGKDKRLRHCDKKRRLRSETCERSVWRRFQNFEIKSAYI